MQSYKYIYNVDSTQCTKGTDKERSMVDITHLTKTKSTLINIMQSFNIIYNVVFRKRTNGTIVEERDTVDVIPFVKR